nr:1-deoxy-D-xylulose-5-phosphate synthase [Papillibacter cinnamivorans]
MILEQIHSPEDVKRLDDKETEALCRELREFLIENVSHTGGHLASNLGVVELTVALHRVFDTWRDRLVFDVGHQCYIHKILTGRKDTFGTLRSFQGVAGFPKPAESEHDAFIAGHASTSVSVALGMARARTIRGEHYSVVAVLGDGALTGGLAYEGLNDAGESGEPLIVVLNDNGMSITENVGGIASHLARQRVKPQYFEFKKTYRRIMGVIPGGKRIYRVTHRVKTAVKKALWPCSMFEDMGFTYLGPVDGHDIKKLTYLLQWARQINTTVLIHVRTVKGKGYPFAEEHPNEFHGISRFQIETGEPICASGKSFSGVFGETMLKLAEKDPRVCAVTAAMQSGTGLDEFSSRYPKRFFDVGIAEGHATAMCAGMAKQGLLPVFAVYSSFLQRAYDMLLHDVAISGLHVVFAVDRAGLVGEDGETHQGAFDASFLAQVPGMTVLCPASYGELSSMLEYALFECSGPVAVRYPRGCEGNYRGKWGRGTHAVLRRGKDITLAGYGVMVNELTEAAELLEAEGISAEVLKLDSIAPLDYDAVLDCALRTGRLLVAEESIQEGSVGMRIGAEAAKRGICLKNFALKNLGNVFIPHGSVPELLAMCGLNGKGIAETAGEMCHDR